MILIAREVIEFQTHTPRCNKECRCIKSIYLFNVAQPYRRVCRKRRSWPTPTQIDTGCDRREGQRGSGLIKN